MKRLSDARMRGLNQKSQSNHCRQTNIAFAAAKCICLCVLFTAMKDKWRIWQRREGRIADEMPLFDEEKRQIKPTNLLCLSHAWYTETNSKSKIFEHLQFNKNSEHHLLA